MLRSDHRELRNIELKLGWVVVVVVVGVEGKYCYCTDTEQSLSTVRTERRTRNIYLLFPQ